MVALVAHQKRNNVGGITFADFRMIKIACIRNVDLSDLSDLSDLMLISVMLQIWHLGFSHFLLPVYVTVCGKFDHMRMLLKFEGCLYAQIGVKSNGCLDDVSLL